VPSAKITTLRNGVDLGLFRPIDRAEARARVGFEEPTLLSVGVLTDRKGHDIAIAALPELKGVRLVIVGDGESGVEAKLRALVKKLGVEDRVTFVPPVSQHELRDMYSAAVALVLASSREGMANVLLESLACGTPVIAARSWGTPEVVNDPVAGVLMDRRDPESLVAAYRELIADYPEREQTRRFAERFDWGPTTVGQERIFGEM
jgi:glycosyltransferase involved in cell wall biosynthesis